jgi:hypothetical protein
MHCRGATPIHRIPVLDGVFLCAAKCRSEVLQICEGFLA